jgi:hypothetical protein
MDAAVGSVTPEIVHFGAKFNFPVIFLGMHAACCGAYATPAPININTHTHRDNMRRLVKGNCGAPRHQPKKSKCALEV